MEQPNPLTPLLVPWTRGIDPQAPLVSQITDTLWQGGYPGYAVLRLPPPFRFVMNLYGGDYQLDPGVTMTYIRWHDRAKMPDLAEMEDVAATINDWRSQGPTLVHCEGGWNRSGLATALALIRSGMTADAAIALLREKRSKTVLFNRFFEEWLRTHG